VGSRHAVTAFPSASAADVEAIASNIESAFLSGSRPHHLVIGGPGSGKTHALDAVLHELRARDVSALVLRPAGWGIGNYTDLLYESLIIHDVELARSAPRGGMAWFRFEELIAAASAARPVLLVLDDIDLIFANLDRGDQGNLRAWVETTANVSVLASAEIMTEPLSHRTWPWFGAFNVTRLKPFTVDEVSELVRRGAATAGRTDLVDSPQSPTGVDAIDALYARLGGNPRAWSAVAAHLGRGGTIDSAMPAVQDALAPHLLPRLRGLSPLSARLIVALARNDEPMTVTSLADDVAVSNQNAAAALGRMLATGWVTRHKPPSGDQRSTLYAIAEPTMGEFIRSRGRSTPLV
jgi:predicted transcriptional regulator